MLYNIVGRILYYIFLWILVVKSSMVLKYLMVENVIGEIVKVIIYVSSFF